MSKTMTKAQLEAQIQSLQQQIEDLQKPKTKDKGFNIFDFTYKQLVRSFLESGKKTEFSFIARHLYDNRFTDDNGEEVKIEGVSKVIKFLYKKGALKLVNIEPATTDEGKQVYKINIKDFDINTETEGKFGNYKIFKKPYESVCSEQMFKKTQV